VGNGVALIIDASCISSSRRRRRSWRFSIGQMTRPLSAGVDQYQRSTFRSHASSAAAPRGVRRCHLFE
jgi:hypothetical protein